jgi:hypothetical protein
MADHVRDPHHAMTATRAVILCVVMVASVAAGCGHQVPYKALAVGDCLPASAQVVGDREPQPPRVPCSQPHRYEVYATPDLGVGSDWPGQSQVYQQAKSLCYGAFASGTGWDPEKIPNGVKELTIDPSQGGFESGKDRSVECLVVLPKDRKGPFIRSSPASPSS